MSDPHNETGALEPVAEAAPPAIVPAERAANALADILADGDRLKDCPIDTIERLFALHEKMLERAERDDAKEREREFEAAFHRVQQNLRPVRKRGWNSHTSSAHPLLEDVIDMIAPILSLNDLSWSFTTELPPPNAPPDTVQCVLIVRHTNGHKERHPILAGIDDKGPGGKPAKTKLHGMMSSATYLERHMLCKVFGIQTVPDNDGNRVSDRDAAAAETGRITESQAADVQALLDEVGGKINLDQFHGYFGIGSVSDLRPDQHSEAVRLLEKARRR